MLSEKINDEGDYAFPGDDERPVDEVIDEVFHEFGRDVLGGPSVRGWSGIAALQKCPRLFYHSRVAEKTDRDEGIRPSTTGALVIGIVFHVLLGLYYEILGELAPEGRFIEPALFRKLYLEKGGPREAMEIAWKCYQHYLVRYKIDYLKPLAVEYEVIDKALQYSCRFDLIARVDEPPKSVDPQEGIVSLPAGIFLLDHKSSTYLREDDVITWQHNGQIIGQVLLYRRYLEPVFGPLAGALVNIVTKGTKTKPPEFKRIWVDPTPERLVEHAQEIAQWNQIATRYAADGTFFGVPQAYPKTRSACTSSWGKCAYFDVCAIPDPPSKPLSAEALVRRG